MIVKLLFAGRCVSVEASSFARATKPTSSEISTSAISTSVSSPTVAEKRTFKWLPFRTLDEEVRAVCHTLGKDLLGAPSISRSLGLSSRLYRGEATKRCGLVASSP